jgi:hypothetical protein
MKLKHLATAVIAVMLACTTVFASQNDNGNDKGTHQNNGDNGNHYGQHKGKGGNGGNGGNGGEGGSATGGSGIGIGVGIGGNSASNASSKSTSTSSVKNSGNSSNTNVNVAEGGSATASNGGQQNSQSTSYVNEQVHQAPTVIAPDAYPSAPCRVSTSIGGSAPLGGLSFGSSKLDDQCDKRETARSFALIGDKEAARQILCTTKAAKNVTTCKK